MDRSDRGAEALTGLPRLNAYVMALHAKHSQGFSVFDAVGRVADGGAPFEISYASRDAHDEESYKRLVTLAAELGRTYAVVRSTEGPAAVAELGHGGSGLLPAKMVRPFVEAVTRTMRTTHATIWSVTVHATRASRLVAIQDRGAAGDLWRCKSHAPAVGESSRTACRSGLHCEALICTEYAVGASSPSWPKPVCVEAWRRGPRSRSAERLPAMAGGGLAGRSAARVSRLDEDLIGEIERRLKL